MIQNLYMPDGNSPNARLYAAFQARKDHFAGLTYERLSELLAGEYGVYIKPGTLRSKLTRGPEFSLAEIRALEELLFTGHDWAHLDTDIAVPSLDVPSGTRYDDYRHRSKGRLPRRVYAYLGGSADVFLKDCSNTVEVEVHRIPGGDEEFVQVVDFSLQPKVSPAEIVGFRPMSVPIPNKLLMIEKKDEPTRCAIRKYEQVDGRAMFVAPFGGYEPLSPEEWRVTHVAIWHEAPDGITI